ncbi:MAG: hypothetical protein ABI791_08485 [Acidobacteriota bacterium]
MNNKCQHCGLAHFPGVGSCSRCGRTLGLPKRSLVSTLLRRFVMLVVALVIAVAGFYVSLLFSADRLALAEKQQVDNAIALLESKGFNDEAFLLRHVAALRGSDNWLNASVEKENAYAATNFPFEIVTIYTEFFTLPADDTERAAILLHEAKHLQGKDEHDAYEFVWKNRSRLGWTAEAYGDSEVWQNVRKQTREYLPAMFVCEFNDFGDCTG